VPSVRFCPLSHCFCSGPVPFCPVPTGLGRSAGYFRARTTEGCVPTACRRHANGSACYTRKITPISGQAGVG
jgi:hypothetical protein